MDNQSCGLPYTAAATVCALEICERRTTLVSGRSKDSHITTSPEYSADIELAADLADNGQVIGPARLAELEQALKLMRKHCADTGAASVAGVASATVSHAANSAEIQGLGAKYDFEIELLDSQRECELGYHAATDGQPKRLVCTLRSHSCSTTWQYDNGFETNYVAAGYEYAYGQFIHNAPSIAEACAAFGLHLKNYLDFLPISMEQLIITEALPCAAFINGSGNSETTASIVTLPRTAVTRKLRELQFLSRPEFEYLKHHTGNIDELLAGTIFMDYLLNRTGMDQLLVSDPGLSPALIQQYFQNNTTAAG